MTLDVRSDGPYPFSVYRVEPSEEAIEAFERISNMPWTYFDMHAICRQVARGRA